MLHSELLLIITAEVLVNKLNTFFSLILTKDLTLLHMGNRDLPLICISLHLPPPLHSGFCIFCLQRMLYKLLFFRFRSFCSYFIIPFFSPEEIFHLSAEFCNSELTFSSKIFRQSEALKNLSVEAILY